MYFNYLVYGKHLSSEIELPALLKLEEHISLSAECLILKKGRLTSRKNSYGANQAYMEIENMAKFMIQSGREITVEILNEKLMEEIFMYIYNRCIPIALFQKKIFPIHGSGILLKNNKAVLFSAPSGVGKSTMMTFFAQKGYQIFTDDSSILRYETDKIGVSASYPMVRLWQNSIVAQKFFRESDKQNIIQNCDKFAFNFHQKFISNEVELAGIVFLNCEGEKFKIRRLEKTDIFYQLMINTYCSTIIFEMGLQKEVFRQMSLMADTIRAWEAIRPEGIDTFSLFTELIEKEIIVNLDK